MTDRRNALTPDALVMMDTIAKAGSGTPAHLAAVLFARAAGVTFAHLPYRGAAPATPHAGGARPADGVEDVAWQVARPQPRPGEGQSGG